MEVAQEVSTNEGENATEKKARPSKVFMEICNELDANIDSELLDRSWKQYDTVGQQCILEVNLRMILILYLLEYLTEKSDSEVPSRCQLNF